MSIMFLACGDEITESRVGIETFASKSVFPECTQNNQGEMVVASDNGLVYYCDDMKWKKLNGENGDKGEKGDKGG